MDYRRDFTIGYRETRDFYLGLALRSWSKGFGGVGLAGALVVWLCWELLELPGALYQELLAALGTGLLLTAGATLSMCLTTIHHVRRDFRRGGGSYVQHTEIDGFGVRVTAQGRQAKLGFDKLMRVEETGKAFYLYLAANRAWILPKAQMEDPAGESARLRAIFTQVVESRRLKLKRG